jgi:23S rRNA pseudouridine2605 synthase
MPDRVRINKFLRDCQLGSRRKCENLILEGLVAVGGRVISDMATLVDPVVDVVEVDGKRVRPQQEMVYLAVNKPRGLVVTASDPRGRPTLYDAISGLPRGVASVGRLDMDSEGLILMTNDGKLAFRLAHPKYAIERVYDVGVEGKADRSLIDSLRKGVQLEDGQARAERVSLVRDGERRFTLRLTLTEGRKREVRRMVAACGFEVCKLKRVRFGSVALGQLAPGAWRHLTRDEVRGLRRLVQDAYLATGNLKRRRTGEE